LEIIGNDESINNYTKFNINEGIFIHLIELKIINTNINKLNLNNQNTPNLKRIILGKSGRYDENIDELNIDLLSLNYLRVEGFFIKNSLSFSKSVSKCINLKEISTNYLANLNIQYL